MKFTITLAVLLGLSTAASSQVVIESSDFTTAGTVLNYENASPDWLFSQNLIEINGQDAVWNVGDWTALSENTDAYISINALSAIIQAFFNNQFLYPTNISTHAIEILQENVDIPLPIDISDARAYFRNDESGYYNTGSSFTFQGFPLITQNATVERVYEFPLHYGDMDTSALAYLTTVPTLGAYGQYGDRFTQVDGEGILTTPYGTYNVLRVHAERYLTDTVYIEQFGFGQAIERPLQTDYVWLSPDVQGPVLEISVIAGAVVSGRMIGSGSPVAVSQLENDNVKVYPNPALDNLNIDSPFAEDATVEIFDLNGKVVLATSIQNNKIDLKKINPGIYLIKISGIQDTPYVQKIVISE